MAPKQLLSIMILTLASIMAGTQITACKRVDLQLFGDGNQDTIDSISIRKIQDFQMFTDIMILSSKSYELGTDFYFKKADTLLMKFKERCDTCEQYFMAKQTLEDYKKMAQNKGNY